MLNITRFTGRFILLIPFFILSHVLFAQSSGSPVTSDNAADMTTLKNTNYNSEVVAISPDSGTIISVNLFNDLERLDISLDQEYPVLLDVTQIAAGQEDTVAQPTLLQFSPDGKLFAAVRVGGENQGVYVWETTSWKQKSALAIDIDTPKDLEFTPDSQTLVVTNHLGKVWLWDTAMWTERVIGEHNLGFCASYCEEGLAISPDSTMLAIYVMPEDGFGVVGIHVYNITNGERISEFPTENIVNDLEFSADSSWLAATISGVVRVYDWETDEVEATSDDFMRTENGIVTNFLTNLSYHPEGKMIAFVDEDGIVRLWDVDTNEVRQLVEGLGKPAHLNYSPDGSLIAVSYPYGESPGLLIDAATGETLFNFDSGKIRFISDWSGMLVYGEETSVRLMGIAAN